jgi:hypothetical protein
MGVEFDVFRAWCLLDSKISIRSHFCVQVHEDTSKTHM